MEIEKAPYITDLNTGVIVLDKSLCIKYLNSSAESMLDTSSKTVVDKPLSNLFYEEPDNLKIFKDCLKKKENFFKVDTFLLLKANKKILCDYYLHPLSNDRVKNGLLLEIISKEFSSEIRDQHRRQTNQEITNALIKNLAHEIKNPLSGIRGAAQLLSQKLPDTTLDEYTNIIINQTDRLTSLVDSMLGPNKHPSLQFLNVHLPIENVFTLMKQEFIKEEIELKKDFDPSIPELMLDSYLFEQAILNLVRNAKEALILADTPSPSIEISTRIIHQEFIGDIKQKTVCKISVKDNGPGIPEEIKESIFFPMISGKDIGSGLGLSITQGIISLHKGTVGFNSIQGETEFYILMPIKACNGFPKKIQNS